MNGRMDSEKAVILRALSANENLVAPIAVGSGASATDVTAR